MFSIVLSGIGSVSNIRIESDQLRWSAPDSDENCIEDYMITVYGSPPLSVGSNNTFIPLSNLNLPQCQEVMITVVPVVVNAGAIEGSASSVNYTLIPEGNKGQV